MAPPDGGSHSNRITMNEEVSDAPVLTPFQLAAKQARADVLEAIRKCGTSNVDILHKQIGTHKLRPLAFLSDSHIPEQPISAHRPALDENIPANIRAKELKEFGRYMASLKK